MFYVVTASAHGGLDASFSFSEIYYTGSNLDEKDAGAIYDLWTVIVIKEEANATYEWCQVREVCNPRLRIKFVVFSAAHLVTDNKRFFFFILTED